MSSNLLINFSLRITFVELTLFLVADLLVTEGWAIPPKLVEAI